MLEPVQANSGSAGGTPQCQNTWVAHEFFLEVDLEEDPLPDPTVDALKTFTNHFEVTRFVNGWDFFADAAQGGEIQIASATGSDLRVLEAFWVVEYVPFLEAGSRVPRVFATTEGRVALGRPTEIAESIITTAPPSGMGLGTDQIAREDYGPARSSLATDGIRLDFAVTRQTMARALLARVALEADLHQTWDRGRHRLIRKAQLAGVLTIDGVSTVFDANLPATFRHLRDADVLIDALAFARTPLFDLRTRLDGLYRPLAHTGDLSGAVQLILSAAETTRVGIRSEARTLLLVRNSTTAAQVLARDLIRRAFPHTVVEFATTLLGLELRFGDHIRVTHAEVSFSSGEVTELSYIDDDFSRINVRVTAWEP